MTDDNGTNRAPSLGQTIIPVDSEHGSLRAVIVVIFVVLWIASYILLVTLLNSGGLNLVAVLVGFALAYGGTTLIEQQLKRRWPSGREIRVDAQGVKLTHKNEIQQQITAEQSPITVLCWRFQTKRRSRVPKGWHIVACALEQESQQLTVYTVMSPAQFKDFKRAEQFTPLKSRTEMGNGQKGRDDLLIAGEQRRLLAAEDHRWRDGVEATADNFRLYIDRLESQFPQWIRG